jgi:hypothetical protein
VRFEADLILPYLPFWLVIYGLALIAWASIARFGMQAWMPPDSRNYIWRGFRLLSAPAVGFARFVTPRYVAPLWWPLLGALWAFGIRFVASLIMLALGMVPRLSTMQPGAGG